MKKSLLFFILIMLLTVSISYAEQQAENTSPFSSDTKVESVKDADESVKISNVEIAKICGITKIEKGFPIDGTVTITNGNNLRMRDYPWGNVVGDYANGTPLKVLGESGEFYLVEIDGKQGYMHKNFVSTTDKQALDQEPYYPGNTRSGAALPLKEAVQISKDNASGKTPAISNSTPGGVSISGNSVLLNVAECYQCNTNCPSPGTACGPTSLAMCFSYYGKGDPYSMFPSIYNECGCTTGGTDAKNLIDVARKHGFSKTDIHWRVNYDFCREQLKAGKPMIAIVEHHYVVMKGIDANGNVIINDPAGPFRGYGVTRTMSPSDFTAWWNKGSACSVIVVE